MVFAVRFLGPWRSFSAVRSRSFLCSVGSFSSGARFTPSTKLFVGGLSWAIDESTLQDAFSSFGKVLDAKIIMDRETGRSKGYGFIVFASAQDAESAQQIMDGKDLNGRQLRVNFAIQKPFSDEFGGDGYGGGRGYGNSFDASNDNEW